LKPKFPVVLKDSKGETTKCFDISFGHYGWCGTALHDISSKDILLKDNLSKDKSSKNNVTKDNSTKDKSSKDILSRDNLSKDKSSSEIGHDINWGFCFNDCNEE
jgi:pentapeptide MXKDX repeat protein